MTECVRAQCNHFFHILLEYFYPTPPLILMPKEKTKPPIHPIQWTQNQHELTWKLLGEMGKHENFRVIFGKTDKDEVSTMTGLDIYFWADRCHQNTPSESKIAVCKCIGQAILPDIMEQHVMEISGRV